MSLSLADAVAKVNEIFATYGSSTGGTDLVGEEWKAGKVYEAWILSVVLERLEQIEGFEVALVGGSKVHLKSSPGPINTNYPHFVLSRTGSESLAVWTDVEFSTLSFHLKGLSGSPGKAHRHELDVVVVPVGTIGYPNPTEIMLGVECKNTGFQKHMARAILGVRRELSMLRNEEHPTPFVTWPRSGVPAVPPSVVMVFSTDPAVDEYNAAGVVFGVDFCHEPMP